MQDSAGDLSGLNDIVVPEAVSFWPVTAAWYALAILVVAILAALCWRVTLRRRASGYRRAAEAELNAIEVQGNWSELSGLLKRTALCAYSRSEVASLTGATWLAFLDRTGSMTGFTSGAGREVEKLAIDPRAADGLSDPEPLLATCRQWIREHSLESGGDTC